MGKIANAEIRLAAMSAGVKMWQIADCLKMHDSNFSRMLRSELPEEKKAIIMAAIHKLATGRSVTA